MTNKEALDRIRLAIQRLKSAESALEHGRRTTAQEKIALTLPIIEDLQRYT